MRVCKVWVGANQGSWHLWLGLENVDRVEVFSIWKIALADSQSKKWKF